MGRVVWTTPKHFGIVWCHEIQTEWHSDYIHGIYEWCVQFVFILCKCNFDFSTRSPDFYVLICNDKFEMKVRIYARLLTEINVCFDPDGYFGLSWSCSRVEVFFFVFCLRDGLSLWIVLWTLYTWLPSKMFSSSQCSLLC